MKGGGVSWHGITPNQDGHEDTQEIQVGLLDDRYGVRPWRVDRSATNTLRFP